MSTHNIGFYEDLTKISLNYHQISSNTHLISSAVIISVYDSSLYILFVLLALPICFCCFGNLKFPQKWQLAILAVSLGIGYCECLFAELFLKESCTFLLILV